MPVSPRVVPQFPLPPRCLVGSWGGLEGGTISTAAATTAGIRGGITGWGGGTQPWTPGSSASPPATPRKTLRCCNALGGAPMGTSSR